MFLKIILVTLNIFSENKLHPLVNKFHALSFGHVHHLSLMKCSNCIDKSNSSQFYPQILKEFWGNVTQALVLTLYTIMNYSFITEVKLPIKV